VTSCGHHNSKKEGQGKKRADDCAAASVPLAEFLLATSSMTTLDGDDISCTGSLLGQVEASSAAATTTQCADADGMDVEYEEADAISAATTTTQTRACSEDESYSGSGVKHHEELFSHDMMGSFNNTQQNHVLSGPLTYPLQVQQQVSWDKFPSGRGLMDIESPSINHCHSAEAISRPPVPALASPNTRALQSMQRILNLSQSAINLFLTGRDDHSALDALQKAEWIRSHLVDSFTTGATTATASLARPRQMRRVGSFPDNNIHHQLQSQSLADVARSSYIYQRMDFDEGMHSFVNLESIDPATVWLPMGRRDTEQPVMYELSPVVEATFVFNFGQIYRRKGDLDAASKCYDRALDVLQCNSVMQMHCHHPLMIPILHNIGQLQYRRGDIDIAIETYMLALQCAQTVYGGRHPHVASALNCLGVLHYHDANSSGADVENARRINDGQIESCSTIDENQNEQQQQQQQHSSTHKAMDLFQQALAIRLDILGPNHVDVATALNNIGRIHVQLDEFDQALEYYEDALRIRRSALGINSLDYAATAFNAGQSFHQQGEFTRAAELYYEFLRVALMKFGHSHRDVAVVLSGIAQIHQEKREYDKALELYEASLCAGKAALGENHSEIAMLLNRMGNFHFEQERLDDALRCYRRGLRIERKVLPPDHPNIVVTLSNLGEIHRQKNEWDEAAKMYGDCLDILRKKYDNKDHIDVASTLSTIGLIHDQRSDTCLSLHYLQDALLMRRRLLGNDHLEVGATLVYIGTIRYRKSDFSVAIELFSESLRIRQAALGKDHRDVAFVLYNIALINQQRGCYEEAIESYSETLRIEKLVLGETHRDVSMTLFKLGEVNKAAGDFDEALKCFQNSLAVERSLSSSANDASVPPAAVDASQRHQHQPDPDHAAMARALNEIGNIHLSRGDVVPMMAAFNEASRMYRAAGLNPSNVAVSGHLYALEVSCPGAAPAA